MAAGPRRSGNNVRSTQVRRQIKLQSQAVNSADEAHAGEKLVRPPNHGADFGSARSYPLREVTRRLRDGKRGTPAEVFGW